MEMETMFRSISYGILTKEQVFETIAKETKGHEKEYEVMIGADSQGFSDCTKVVAVVVLYNVGHGGKFFYRTEHLEKFPTMREKIYNEAQESLNIAKDFVTYMYDHDVDIHTVIHVDIGVDGKTRDFIDEIVGWITSEGFEAFYKPNSIAASFIADYYSK